MHETHYAGSVCNVRSTRVTEFDFLTENLDRGGRKGGTNTAIPHMVAREYRNTASKFSQIPKAQLQMGKKLTLSILQILLSNRNNAFMSVFPSQGAKKSSVRLT